MAVYVDLRIKQNSQSVTANTSNVTVQVVVSWDYGSFNAYTEQPNVPDCELRIDGVSYRRWAPFNRNRTQSGSEVYIEKTVNITHDADGNKELECWVQFRPKLKPTAIPGVYDDNISMSESLNLTFIPRASQPSCITWPDHTQDVGDFGKTISIHMNRKSDQFTHTVRYAFGKLTGTIATGVTTGTTWTIPLSFMELLPSAVKGSGTIYVDTIYQGTVIGTKYCGFTATVPASVKPACSLSLDDVANIDDIYGSPVQALSRIKVKINATVAYKSPIAAYEISIDGVKYTTSEATSNALKNAGASPVTVKVTDQRGRSASASYTMQVQAYTSPALPKMTVHRCDEDGTSNEQGEYIRVDFSAAVSAMSNKNTAAYSLKYKKSTASTYTSVAFSDLANVYTVDNKTYIFPADSNSAYDITVEVKDRHHTTQRSTSASTAFSLINWGANGTSMALGKVAERENAFEVALDNYFLGTTVQTGNRYVASSPGKADTEGFVLMARITVTDANADTPITFVFTQRRALTPMHVHVTLTNPTAETSSVNKVVYEGSNYDAYLSEVDGLTWDLYVKKASAWDTITLQDWWTSKTMESRVSVTFPGTWAATVPTPYWKATPVAVQSIRDYIYPVGSVYISWSHVSPATLFGGTWVRIQNAFLWGCDEDGEIGITGGEKTHVLTANEMPAHTHGSVYSGNVTGSKTHSWLASGGTNMAYGTVSAGGGQAHNNMPPYVQVSIWRRTA